MRLGFALPQFGGHARQTDAVDRFATVIEEEGAASLWAGDRVLAPVAPVVGYGGGSTFPAEFRAVLDPFVLLTVAATATRSVRLGFSTLIAPYYSPILLARALTSIDALSGGRLVVGLASGWSPDEFRAVGVPWHGRGARLEESLDVLEKVWAEGPVEHRGGIWSIPASYVDLEPSQRPRPPIYLGALTPAALRRVGRRADGWLPVTVVPQRFDPAVLIEGLALAKRSAARSGRDPDHLDAILRVNVAPGTALKTLAEQILRTESEAGIDHAFVDLMYLADSIDKALDVGRRLLDLTRG